MNEFITTFVLLLIEKKAKLPKDCDVNSFNYIDTGYVDFLGIIKFVVEIESKFDIEISDSDMASSEFRTVGGLGSTIKNKWLIGKGKKND